MSTTRQEKRPLDPKKPVSNRSKCPEIESPDVCAKLTGVAKNCGAGSEDKSGEVKDSLCRPT